MTLNFLMAAGGLLVLVIAGAAIRLNRAREDRIKTDQLSGDWLAQARGREEQPW